MATNKELERMINNVEKAIGRVRNRINMIPSLLDGHGNLREDFLQLRSLQSKLIEISTNLQKRHLENYQKERNNK